MDTMASPGKKEKADLPKADFPYGSAVEIMRAFHSLDISSFESGFLLKTLERRIEASGCKTQKEYLELLSKNRVEAAALFEALHVVYSEFFRNGVTFALLESRILPSLSALVEKDVRKGLRIWCAGCAAGHEAWSVAMLLEEIAVSRGRPVPYTVFATDISEPALELARAGLYSAAAVKNVKKQYMDKYFARQGELFLISESVRGSVNFSLQDLLDRGLSSPAISVYGDFDLILCNNVLIYYNGGARRFILNKLASCLATWGYLVTGEADRIIVDRYGAFREFSAPAAIFSLDNNGGMK